MTVRELIVKLLEMPQDAEVAIVTDKFVGKISRINASPAPMPGFGDRLTAIVVRET